MDAIHDEVTLNVGHDRNISLATRHDREKKPETSTSGHLILIVRGSKNSPLHLLAYNLTLTE